MVSLPKLSLPKKSRNPHSKKSSAYVDFDQLDQYNDSLGSATYDDDAEEKVEEKEAYEDRETPKHRGDKKFGNESNSKSSSKTKGRPISRANSKLSAKASVKSFRGFRVIPAMPRRNPEPSPITAGQSPSDYESASASVESARSNHTGGTKSSVAVTANEDRVEAKHMEGERGGEVGHGIVTGRSGEDTLIADQIADEDGWPVTEERGEVANVLVPMTSNKTVRSPLVPVTKTRSSGSSASSAASGESPCIVASATMISINSSGSASSGVARAAFSAAAVGQGLSRDGDNEAVGRVPSSRLSAENHHLFSSVRALAGNIETGVSDGVLAEMDPYSKSMRVNQCPPQEIFANAGRNKNEDKSVALLVKESLLQSLGSALSHANDTLAPVLDPSVRSITAKSSRSASSGAASATSFADDKEKGVIATTKKESLHTPSLRCLSSRSAASDDSAACPHNDSATTTMMAKSSASASFDVIGAGTSRDSIDRAQDDMKEIKMKDASRATALNVLASGSASSGLSNTPSLMDNNSDDDYGDDEGNEKSNAAAAQTPRASNIYITQSNNKGHDDFEGKENIGTMVETPRARSGCLNGSNEILQDLAQSFGNRSRSGASKISKFFNDKEEEDHNGKTRKSAMTRSVASARSKGSRISSGSSKGMMGGGRASMRASRASNNVASCSRANGQDNSGEEDDASTLSGKAFGGSMAGSIAISQASSKHRKRPGHYGSEEGYDSFIQQQTASVPATRRDPKFGSVSATGVIEDVSELPSNESDLVSGPTNVNSRGSSLSVDIGEDTNDEDDVEEMYSDFEEVEGAGKKSFAIPGRLSRFRSLRSSKLSNPRSSRFSSLRSLGKVKRQSLTFRRSAGEPAVRSNALSSRKVKQLISTVSHAPLVSGPTDFNSRGSSPSVDMNEDVAGNTGEKSTADSETMSPRRFFSKLNSPRRATFSRVVGEPAVRSSGSSSNIQKQSATFSRATTSSGLRSTADSSRQVKQENVIVPSAASEPALRSSTGSSKRFKQRSTAVPRATSEPTMICSAGSFSGAQRTSVTRPCTAADTAAEAATTEAASGDFEHEVSRGFAEGGTATAPNDEKKNTADSRLRAWFCGGAQRNSAVRSRVAANKVGDAPNTESDSGGDSGQEASRGLAGGDAAAIPGETKMNASDGADGSPIDGVADDPAEMPPPDVTSDRGVSGMDADSNEPEFAWDGFAEDGCDADSIHGPNAPYVPNHFPPAEGAAAGTDSPDGCSVAQDQQQLEEGHTTSSWAVDLDTVDLILPFLHYYGGGGSQPAGVYKHPRIIEEQSGRPVNIVHVFN